MAMRSSKGLWLMTWLSKYPLLTSKPKQMPLGSPKGPFSSEDIAKSLGQVCLPLKAASVGSHALSQPGHKPSERLALLEAIWARGQAESMAFLETALLGVPGWTPDATSGLLSLQQGSFALHCWCPSQLITCCLSRFGSAGNSCPSLWDQSHHLIVRLPLLLQTFPLSTRAPPASLSLLLCLLQLLAPSRYDCDCLPFSSLFQA